VSLNGHAVLDDFARPDKLKSIGGGARRKRGKAANGPCQAGEGWCGMGESDAKPRLRRGPPEPGLPQVLRDPIARVATVAVLLAVAVIGLRERGTFSHQGSSLLTGAGSRVITSVFAGAEGAGLIACVTVLVLLMRRPRRRRHDDDWQQQPWRPPVSWWAKALGVLLALALLVAPFVILVTARGHRAVTTPGLTAPGVLSSRTGHPAAPPPGNLVWPLLAGMIFVVAAVLTLAVLASRGRHRTDLRPPGQAPAPLAEGLAAGHVALLAGGEPRAAIIACYAALEGGFAAAGSVPAAADTPAEVLTRAGAAGLVRSGSAGVLTGLFRRARYSAEPMTRADSDAAASALAQMRADLASAGQSAAPGSGP
jgi:hypothetical protein